MIILLPGSSLLIILFVYNKSLFVDILKGNKNIMPVLKDVFNENYNRYFNASSK